MKIKSVVLGILIGLLCFMQKISALSWWDMTPLELRERLHQRIMEIEAPFYDVWAIEDRVVKNASRSNPVRIYLPNEKDNLPVIILIHGGAWIAGNLDTHDNLARYLCSQVEAVVVSVEYMNAPEGKFPLQLEQCYDVLRWVKEEVEKLAVSSRLAVVGDSAGGNMAAALCLMVRDRQGAKIDLQVLINPAPDLRCEGSLERKNDNLDTLRWQAVQYLSDPSDTNNPYVSPLAADNLNDLPKAVILLAEYDELRGDGEKYAQRLRESGVPTFVYCQKGSGHLAGHGAKVSSQAKESIDVAVKAIKEVFDGTVDE